jgi:prophage antirepressor-like protein
MNALIDLKALRALEDGQSPSDGKCREYIIVNIGGKDHQIKLSGTIEDPHFCGNEATLTLGYKNPKKALLTHVKPKHKKELAQLVGPKLGPTFLGSTNLNISYNDGKAVYISEPGLYSLIMNSNALLPKSFKIWYMKSYFQV